MPNLELTDDQKRKIAETLCSEIRESEREKGRLLDRWRRLWAIHDCEVNTSQVQVIEGMKGYFMPLSRPKADRIAGGVVNGITGLDPYVQAFDSAATPEDLDKLQLDLKTLIEDAGDRIAIEEGTVDALITNCGFWRFRPFANEVPYDNPANNAAMPVTRLDWEAIDPRDMCCYPPYFGTVAAAKTVGHRYSDMLFQIEQNMESGIYYECEVTGGDDPLKGKRGFDEQTEKYAPQQDSDGFVECWEVISTFKIDDDAKYKKYICVVALTDEKLLACQEYPYEEIYYVDVRTEASKNRIFPSSSLMQRLQDLQLGYSDAYTGAIQATWASIGPITILTGGGLQSKVTQAKPFMVIEAPQGTEVQYIQAQPQIGALPLAIEKSEEGADALTGISRTGQSQESSGKTTATEIAGLLQAQAEAKDTYTQRVAESVVKIANLAFIFYKKHYRALKKAYGNRLTLTREELMALNPTFQVNGKNGTNNPAIVLQKIQVANQMIANVPNSGYDPVKLLDQGMQMLDFPWPLEKLKTDDPIAMLVRQPEVQQLLMTGMPLPEIIQEIQQRHAASQQPGNGAMVQQPPMGGGPEGIGEPPPDMPGDVHSAEGGIPPPMGTGPLAGT